MPVHRREFLFQAGALAIAAQVPEWRTFEITTAVEVLEPKGVTRVWVPLPLQRPTAFQRTIHNSVKTEGGAAHVRHIERLSLVEAEYPDGARPYLTVVSTVKTRDWAVDFEGSRQQRGDDSDVDLYLRPTKLMPTDGIVKARAEKITTGAKTDIDKARAIYEWIVENTYRKPTIRGCGTGNICSMLESGDLGGKCADLNALYVGLARSVRLPARDVYGLRTAPSRLGLKSLGMHSGDITKAQHCRAEVFLTYYGWVPVDPADVRKVMLEEPPGHRPLEDDLVKQTRARLFGSWEMNWIAYNYAQEFALPGSDGAPLHYFMYPQAETADGRLDCLDAERFRYRITCREI